MMDTKEFTATQIVKIFGIPRPTLHVWLTDCNINPDIRTARNRGEGSRYSFANVVEVGLVQELVKRKWGAVGDKKHKAIFQILSQLRKLGIKSFFSQSYIDSENFQKNELWLYLYMNYKKAETTEWEVGFSAYNSDETTREQHLLQYVNDFEKKWNDMRFIPLNSILLEIYRKIKKHA